MLNNFRAHLRSFFRQNPGGNRYPSERSEVFDINYKLYFSINI